MPMVFVGGGPGFQSSGMTKSGSQQWAQSSDWIPIESWTPDTGGYPGSTVTSDRLDVQGSKTDATIAAQAAFSGGNFNRTHTIRLVDQDDNVLATGSGVGANAGTCTVTASNIDLTGITSVGVQMWASASSGGNVSGGAGTFATIT